LFAQTSCRNLTTLFMAYHFSMVCSIFAGLHAHRSRLQLP
jgi:hypothetical protein